MKQRFSSLDVKVITHELSTQLVGLRVNNIYDLSSRIFLLKLHAPNTKQQLLIDSGFRCHLTSFVRTTAAAPSPFVSKLRKWLRTRRVTAVSQVGTDRIIEFSFSDGLYRLYLEFYAGGNIVLTDKELNILSLLRRVDEGPEYEQVRIGGKYNLDQRQNYNGVPTLTVERIKEGLEKAIEKQNEVIEGAKAPKKAKKKGKDALRKALAVSINEFPPMLIDHAFRVKDFDASISPQEVVESTELLEKLREVLKEAAQVVESVTSAEIVKGYIIAKKIEATNGSEQTDGASKHLYDDFHPFKPAQCEADPNLEILEYEEFNKTVDEFYSSLEGQKLESRLAEREANAKKKLDEARAGHEKRIGGLQQVQELNIRKAEAIQANVARVEEATAAVNGLIAQGMDWVDIGGLIEQEQRRGNPVAQLIKLPLKLHENTVTLLLGEAEANDEDDSGYVGSDTESEVDSDDEKASQATSTRKSATETLTIDVDLALTAWANASQYYDQKKSAAVKEEKTVQASTKALKSAEQKITADLKKGLKQEKDILRPLRKQFWFEKFHYFISSDGYLVLGGKDAQQNELLYRRYLKKGDIYVHADMLGAPSVIIKNNPSTPDAPIPPSTLSQAGNLSVCGSSAWDSKAVMSAWWVNADQVSKTTPTGEYLQTGGFMIRGQKNFLPPSQLLMGFAVVWQISDESKGRHRRHRVAQQEEEREQDDIAATNGSESKDYVEAKEDEAVEESEDEFPDAKIADQDSDEDFPDAKPESGSESEDDDAKPSTNPLQTGRPSQTNGESVPDDSDDAADEAAQAKEEDDDEYMMSGGLTPLTASKPDPFSAKETTPKHLSAHQRRKLKKGGKTSQKPTDDSSGDESTSAPARPDADSSKASTTGGIKQQPLPRGKRGKAKKAAAKYADQDEEDRELAMQLLGSKIGQEAAAAEAATKKAKDEEERKTKERRRQQHQNKLAAEEKKRTAGADAAINADGEPEDDAEAEAVWKNEMDALDTLVGKALPGDELLAAIPVCAPWTALANYKYKVKLQPGAVKKGKATKEILSKWQSDAKNPKAVDATSQDVERMWPREVELLAGVKDTEAIGIVPLRTFRSVMSGGLGGAGGGKDGGKGKGTKSARGGRGSKKR